MTSQTLPNKRTTKSNIGNSIKMLIMAGSLAGTIGGWAILAAGQLQQTASTVQQTQAIIQPTNNSISNNSQTTLRQVTIPSAQPRAVTRTRSSR